MISTEQLTTVFHELKYLDLASDYLVSVPKMNVWRVTSAIICNVGNTVPFYILLAGLPGFARDSCIFSRQI